MQALREFERFVPQLDVTDEVWLLAIDLARRCRAADVSVPATDLLMAACARPYGATVEHADTDFDLIAKVGSWR